MSNQNDFLQFCSTDTGTNLLTEVEYLAAADRISGNKPGVASAKLNNRAIRQAAYIASQIAQYISDTLSQDVLDNATPATLLAQIHSAFQPSGLVQMWGGATAPAGWHLCDGSSLVRATYPALFTAIGTTYGAADGTHFTLPDCRGVFVRGAGAQTISGIVHTGTRGTTEGDQLQGHLHQETHATTTGGATIQNLGTGSGNGANTTAQSWTLGPSTDGVNGTPRTGDETRPANVTLSYIIKL